MGSTAKAIVTGFICRLCSEQKKVVIHLYSSKAKKRDLLMKIKSLPISVEKYDNLPKVICEQCAVHLELQYNLLQRMKKNFAINQRHKKYHGNGRCPVECPLHGRTDPSWQAQEGKE